MGLFERATKEKVRFAMDKGSIGVEDLWDLPLIGLNDIAKELSRTIKAGAEESFIDVRIDPTIVLTKFKLDVVKRVIEVRLEEKDKAARATDRRAKKAQIMGILAEKQDESLKGSSAEELQAMLDAL